MSSSSRPSPNHEAQHRSHAQRLTEQLRADRSGKAIATASSARRIARLRSATIEQRVREHHRRPHPEGGVVSGLVERALEQGGGLEKAVVVQSAWRRAAASPRHAVRRDRHGRWSRTSRLRARAGSPASKWWAADRMLRSGVSPPSPIASSMSSAAAAGAPRIRAISAAASSERNVRSSPLAAASARCLALSSGSSTISARRRCIARRRAGAASV